MLLHVYPYDHTSFQKKSFYEERTIEYTKINVLGLMRMVSTGSCIWTALVGGTVWEDGAALLEDVHHWVKTRRVRSLIPLSVLSASHVRLKMWSLSFLLPPHLYNTTGSCPSEIISWNKLCHTLLLFLVFYHRIEKEGTQPVKMQKIP